jgi:hypothetical protein
VARTPRLLAALLLAPVLLVGCSDDGKTPDPGASAPLPGVTLPPGALLDLVPTPEEVPAGMVPVLAGSGERDLQTIAGYSGTGAAATAAAASLTKHGFTKAYVAQYANQATGQVLSVVVSQFATAAGATADYDSDANAAKGSVITTETVGDASSATKQTITGSVSSELVLLRFRRGTTTWAVAYQAAPTADPAVPVMIAKAVLARTTT